MGFGVFLIIVGGILWINGSPWGIALVIVGFLVVAGNSDSGKDDSKNVEVDWAKVAEKIKDVRNVLDHIYRIKIQSEGDIAYAEPLGDGHLMQKKYGYLVLSVTLDISDSFTRAHADDYIGIAYPYEDKWTELLDNNVGIEKSVSPADHSVICFLNIYLPLPQNISCKKVQQELKKYNVNV